MAHVGAQLSIQQRDSRQDVLHHGSRLGHLVVAHLADKATFLSFQLIDITPPCHYDFMVR